MSELILKERVSKHVERIEENRARVQQRSQERAAELRRLARIELRAITVEILADLSDENICRQLLSDVNDTESGLVVVPLQNDFHMVYARADLGTGETWGAEIIRDAARTFNEKLVARLAEMEAAGLAWDVTDIAAGRVALVAWAKAAGCPNRKIQVATSDL